MNPSSLILGKRKGDDGLSTPLYAGSQTMIYSRVVLREIASKPSFHQNLLVSLRYEQMSSVHYFSAIIKDLFYNVLSLCPHASP